MADARNFEVEAAIAERQTRYVVYVIYCGNEAASLSFSDADLYIKIPRYA
jgi:hypothetical protein